MAIDPSIALSANSGGGNLLQTLSGATQLRGIRQQQQANVAASQAYKDATAPDGTIDYGRLTAALSQGPAAYNLPQIQAQVNEARNSALNYDKGKLEMAQKRIDMLSGGFGGLLASGNITPQSIAQLGVQGIKLNLFTPEEYVHFTSDMPGDPSQLQDWTKQKFVGFNQSAERLKTLMPQTQVIDSGGQQQMMAIDPITGQPRVTGVINNTMTPGQGAQPTPVFDPASNTMRSVTLQQFADMAGGGAGGSLPQANQPGGLGTGRLQPITQAPGLQAAPALGAQEAAQTVGKGAAEASLALQSQADAAPQAIYQLQNMRSALDEINTGPNADWQGKAKALALQVAPDVATRLGLDPQKVASQEEFKKYSVQLAQGLAQGLGTGTDEKLASAVSANPNISLSKLGNQQIIDVLIATQRGTQAKNLAWQNSGLPPEKYNQFSTQFNKDIDPRVFAAQDMDQAARYKMLDSLPKRDQEAFKQSWLKARAAGYVQ